MTPTTHNPEEALSARLFILIVLGTAAFFTAMGLLLNFMGP